MRIKSNETLALVIDYQEKLVPAMNEKEEFVKNSAILIKGLNALGVPIIVTQQYTKGLGNTISEIREALCKFTPYDKITFSCVGNQEIMEAVRSANVKNVVLCGCEAHICVLQTAIDLIEMGINVIVVEDCIASRKEQDMFSALLRAEKEGALITTYEAILFELCERGGSDTFKYISKLIK